MLKQVFDSASKSPISFCVGRRVTDEWVVRWVVWNSWMRKGEAENMSFGGGAGGMSPLRSSTVEEPEMASPRPEEEEGGEELVDVVVSESDDGSMHIDEEEVGRSGYTTNPAIGRGTTTITRVETRRRPRMVKSITLSGAGTSGGSSTGTTGTSLMVTRSGVCV